MSIALATAWNPRGELARFYNLRPRFQEAYAGMAFALPPGMDAHLVNQLRELPQVTTAVTEDWSHGRYMAMKLAATTEATHIQYADFDRLLRWVETRPEEWQQILREIPDHDCLILGRSPAAYQTHPKALIETEAISNRLVSFLAGQPMDVSAGSKCFSRPACESILANSTPGNALGTDAEWPLILKQLGFQVEYVEVDGLDWESADRYRDEAADLDRQMESADMYDADPANWSRRVAVAMEIVQVGLDTVSRNFTQQSKTES